MNKLDMIKAFAKLNGDNIRENFDSKFAWLHATGAPYNPLTDWSLTFKAALDYGVSIVPRNLDSGCFYCEIDIDKGTDSYVGFTTLNKNYVPELVVECILKSKGLWDE